MRSKFKHFAPALLGTVLFAGCGDSITGDAVMDAAPETEVTATPPVLSETEYTVSFFWTGADPDGSIRGYQWRISDNGPDGVVDVTDTLSTELPWNFTESTDSTFVVTADIEGFPKDAADSLSEKSTRFWQTHTFFVRSVDQNWNVDPTPANVSFTATTLAPTVNVNLPAGVQPNSCTQAPPAIAFGWDATDPDNLDKKPSHVRYLLKKFGNADDPCLLQVDFEAGLFPISNDDDGWSDWIRYEADLDSGKIVRFPARPVSDLGTSYVFAVQARDVAGAVTPLFEWGRNVRHVKISDTKSPFLTVTERFLGTDAFQKTNISKRFTIASQQVVEFEWFADATNYGNLIEGYRYGFNLLDPDDPDDPGWVVPWGTGPNWRRAAPRVFSQGSPNFIVQARDNSNQLTRATYLFQVVQVARRSEQRRLLLVDDHLYEPSVPSSAQIDAKWDTIWRQLIQGVGVAGFQSSDVVDAVDETLRLTFPLVNDYRGVIWFIGPSGIVNPSFFKSGLAPLSRTTPQFNWLEVYQSFVGNLLFVGSGATQSMLEPHNQEFPLVLNATGEGSLGTVEVGGERVNAGTLRYPYTGWCLEALDMVRPPDQKISGERVGGRIRDTKCSSIVYAGPVQEFLSEYETTALDVPALLPSDIREFGPMKYYIGDIDPGGNERPGENPTELTVSALGNEEFYNVNVTSRPVNINLRNCQVPMYRAIARRDVDEPSIYSSPLAEGWDALGLGLRDALVDSVPYEFNPEIWLDNCASQLSRENRATSPISLQTIAVASGVFSGRGSQPPSKQFGTLLASDFLWGFNPIQFRQEGVRSALRWIIIDHWGVNTDF
jgi:hypothetical protein